MGLRGFFGRLLSLCTHLEKRRVPTPMTPTTPHIPRLGYGVTMAVSCAAAIGAGLFMANRAGANADTLGAVAIALTVLASVCVVPLLGPPLVSDQSWGLVVLGCGAMRTMLALGAMLVLIEVQGLERRPVVMGILIGAMGMMIAEAAVAVRALAARDRHRLGNGGIGAGGGAGTTQTRSADDSASSGSAQ